MVPLEAIPGAAASYDLAGRLVGASPSWRALSMDEVGARLARALVASGADEEIEEGPGHRVTARRFEGGVLVVRVELPELLALRARLDAVVENTPNVAIQAYDEHGRVLRWNKASERLYGFTAEEAIGKTLDALILTPAEAAELAATIRRVLETGETPAPFTSEIRGKDGRRGVVYSTFFRTPGLREFICMDIDITELQRGQEAQKRLVALLEATTDFVAITDIDGRPVYLNRALRAALRLADGEELDRLPLERVYPPETARFLRNYAFPAAIRQGSWSGEAPFVGADGVARPTSQVVLSHRNAKGELELVSTIARDLSAQKALEAQLLQSQKMEGMGRLAGGIAHDFNNVLTAIVGSAELVKLSVPRDHPARDGIDHIVKASERARELTRQLLTFARKQAHSPQVVDLGKLLLDTERMLRRTIGEDIELVTEVPELPAHVLVDPTHFEQLLLNLVVNARDAMPQGGRLLLALQRLDGPPAIARLVVSDTGVGMSEEVRARAFEPFFTTKEPGKGTGLGLATVYGIVTQSGGRVDVESALGVGTTFTVELPLSEHAPSEAAHASPAESPKGGHETVLIVEDEPLVRDLARRILGGAGYSVLFASGPIEALDVAAAHAGRIDLLLTDVVMPRMSGRQLAALLKTRRPNLAVLYMSGYTEDRGASGPEARNFLPKPFTPGELGARVRELLDAPRALS